MVAGNIVDLAILHQSSPTPPGSSGKTMVDHVDVEEAGRGPAQHVGFDFIDRIRPGAYPQSTNRFPTGSTVDLDSPTHMKLRVILKNLLSIVEMIENAAANADLRVVAEFLKRALKVVRLERQVPVQLTHVLPVL